MSQSEIRGNCSERLAVDVGFSEDCKRQAELLREGLQDLFLRAEVLLHQDITDTKSVSPLLSQGPREVGGLNGAFPEKNLSDPFRCVVVGCATRNSCRIQF